MDQIKWPSQYLAYFSFILRHRKKKTFYKRIPCQIRYKTQIFLFSWIVSIILWHVMQSTSPRSSTLKVNIFSNFFNPNFNISIIVTLNIAVFKKIKIYHQVQHDKLYKLQTKVYFNCVLFFKKRKTLCDQSLAVMENRLHTIWDLFEYKKYRKKINCSL